MRTDIAKRRGTVANGAPDLAVGSSAAVADDQGSISASMPAAEGTCRTQRRLDPVKLKINVDFKNRRV
jgi:hypothetical protein